MAARALLTAALLLGVAAAAPRKAPKPSQRATPDFSGTWERYPAPGEKADPRYAPSPIPDPLLKPQYRAEWAAGQKILKERLEESQPAGDNYVHCIPDGMPAMMMGMFPMEIFQRRDQINITQEAFSQTRRIYMNRKLPKWDEVDAGFYGHAVAHWEGDTLVIETIGIKANVKFRWTPHSEEMKITERIRMIGPDMLQDKITIEDPYLEKPWTYSYTFKRMKDYKLQEYVCEDNREYFDADGKMHFKLGK